MATPALSNLVQLRGLLGGDGSRALYVSACTSPVPLEPPPHLAGVVRAVHDKAGRIADWRIDLSHVTQGGAEVFPAYLNWYSTFSVHRYVGERAFVNALLKWARPKCSVLSLEFLQQQEAYVEFKTALGVRSQTDRLRRVLEASDDQVLGIFAPPEHHTAARAILPSGDQPVLAADHCKAFATAEGLFLHLSGPRVPNHPILATGWEVRGREVDIETPDGGLHLDEPCAAALMWGLGKRASRVQVRPQPLRALAAFAVRALHDAAQVALNSRSGFSSFTGPATPYLSERD